jgi:uncharacterized protein (DUF433 family)
MKESMYKGKLDRREVESVVAPLRDKEPTPAWRKQFKDVLKHYGVTLKTLMRLTAASNKVNQLGRRYGEYALQALLAHYNDGHNDWTKNGFRTINDHLDILVDYLSKPEENEPETECDHVPTLRERLEKELEEGKWPRVEEKRRTTEEMVELLRKDTPPTAVYTKHEKLTANDISEFIKAVDETSETNKVRVKRVKKNKKHFVKAPDNLFVIDSDIRGKDGLHLPYIHDKKHHKSNNIYITIKIGR